MRRQNSLFEAERLTLDDAIELSVNSLRAYGERYPHWSVAYSGGKDSSATVTFVAWAIKSGLVPTPKSLTVLYADTRMEYPPYQPQVEDCGFRMLQPHEIQSAMAFPSDYTILGTRREQVKQLGNAVTPPVMKMLIERCVQSLQ